MGSNEYYDFFYRIEQHRTHELEDEINFKRLKILFYSGVIAYGVLATAASLICKSNVPWAEPLTRAVGIAGILLPLMPVCKNIKNKNKLEKELENI